MSRTILYSPSTSSTTSSLAVNVRAHGATGNGTTNDTDAIQAAIDAAHAAGGGEVVVPAGVYIINLKNDWPGTGNISALLMRTGVTLRLMAGAELKLGANQAVVGTNVAAIIRNANNFGSAPYDKDMAVVGDGTLNGNSANNTGGITNGIYFGKATRAFVKGIKVKNVRGTAPGPPGETIAVTFWRCMDYGVSDVQVFSDDGGDTASGVGSNQCLNGRFVNVATYGLKWGVGNTHWDSSEILVANCHSFLNGGFGFLTEHSEGVTFQSCVAGGKVTDYDMAATNTALSPIGELGRTTLGNAQDTTGTAGGFGIDSGTRITLRDCTSSYNGASVAQNSAGVRVYGSTTLTKDILLDGCRIFGNRRGIQFDFGDGAAAAVARMKATRIERNNIIGPNKYIDGSQAEQVFTTSSGAATSYKGIINGFLVTAHAPVAATGVAVANPFPFDVEVILAGGTVTGVTVTPGGPVPSAASAVGTTGPFRLPHGGSITLTYSAAPTWTWVIP